MTYKKRNNISEVSFTYVGTDAQFNAFLKTILHDYLAVDNPYAAENPDAEDSAEEKQVWQQVM